MKRHRSRPYWRCTAFHDAGSSDGGHVPRSRVEAFQRRTTCCRCHARRYLRKAHGQAGPPFISTTAMASTKHCIHKFLSCLGRPRLADPNLRVWIRRAVHVMRHQRARRLYSYNHAPCVVNDLKARWCITNSNPVRGNGWCGRPVTRLITIMSPHGRRRCRTSGFRTRIQCRRCRRCDQRIVRLYNLFLTTMAPQPATYELEQRHGAACDAATFQQLGAGYCPVAAAVCAISRMVHTVACIFFKRTIAVRHGNARRKYFFNRNGGEVALMVKLL